MRHPRWSQLTGSQQLKLNNGCGPSWWPVKVKKFVHKYLMGWLFNASCGHHDFGYVVGGSELRRLECDLKFGRAIFLDAGRALCHAVLAVILAPLFFLLVRCFGWMSFNYGEPKTLEEVTDEL